MSTTEVDVELGISDSDAPTVVEEHWDDLRIRRARIVVPFDVATTSGAAGGRRRENFEEYRSNAASKDVDVFVVLSPSADVRGSANEPLAPTADAFAEAFEAFLQAYPDMRTIAPWNEPNNRDARHYPLAGDPELAADYWLRAHALMGSEEGTLVAGDFAGIPGDDRYVNAYQRHLASAGARPHVWAFHDHGDVNAFQEHGSRSARIARFYLSKLGGRWSNSRIWIDEIGARYRDARRNVWGDESQARATSFVLGLATLDPRIEAIYYYNFSNQCSIPSRCAVQDRGLVSPTPFNGEPPDYDEVNRRRAAYDVFANRGPAIALRGGRRRFWPF